MYIKYYTYNYIYNKKIKSFELITAFIWLIAVAQYAAPMTHGHLLH